MPADIIEFPTPARRFEALFASYDWVAVMTAALREIGDDLDADIGEGYRERFARDFPVEWRNYYRSDVSDIERVEFSSALAELCTEIEPYIRATTECCAERPQARCSFVNQEPLGTSNGTSNRWPSVNRS